MGINLEPDDITFRCNLVTLSNDEEYDNKTMIDYGSDEITTEESSILINSLQEALGTDTITFYPGISYRHCVVWEGGPNDFSLTPPHDILEKRVKDYLPSKNANEQIINDLMRKSVAILKYHPINKSRIERGLNPATSIWLWGNGTKLTLPSFNDKYGVDGAVISAVDLIKGIGICAGMKSIDVDGATGNIHTNFTGKADAAIKALDDNDFVYLHIEAPDECGHRHEVENKVHSIELIDNLVVGPIFKAMQKYDDFKIAILPDHPTPLTLRTHTSDPVPYILYQHSKSNGNNISGEKYTEATACETGNYIELGHTFMNKLMTKENK
jgi:2,3-bisphosphoglycerate-independent phosphoglycerate mutase